MTTNENSFQMTAEQLAKFTKLVNEERDEQAARNEKDADTLFTDANNWNQMAFA